MSDRPPDSVDRLPIDESVSSRIEAAVTRAATDSPSAPAAAYGNFEARGVHLADYFRVLHKRRWTAVTAFVLVFGTVAVVTFTTTPVFTARAQVLIENENSNVVQFEEVVQQNRTTDYYQTQYRILQSRALARRTLTAENLWNERLFTSNSQGLSMNPISWMAAGIEYAGGWFAGQTPDALETPDATEDAAQSTAIDELLKRLTVSPVRNSRLVDVNFRSPDPTLSSRIANALVRQYIEMSLEIKFLASKEATEFLNARTSEQRKALEKSEQALQRYREQTGAVAIEDRQNIVVQRLADLNAAVTRARTERIEKESIYNQIRSIEGDRSALDTFPAILSNTFIQQLKIQLNELQRTRAQMAEKLGSRHPDMLKIQSAIDSTDGRINAEIQKVVQSLRTDYQAAQANEKSLQASLDQQRAEAQELNRASIQYGVLQRDAASNQSLFTGLLERARETNISGELRTSNIRIVDEAEIPKRPSSPNLAANFSGGILGGLLLGLGLAFFMEYLDSRIKHPEEIKTLLGLPFLGMVPLFNPKIATGPPLIGNGMPHEFGEAFRSIRSNVLFSSVDDGTKTLVVTSTGPGEGKSVVSANLAMSLALAGQRVLLIDADMRRPKLHELFGIAQQPGLSNVLVGDAKASDSVRRTLTPNLWMMAAGKNPPNPAELLGSKRFHDFGSSLRDHFDWVVIDSPPVMAVTDATVIAHNATGVVFVVGCEMTHSAAARSAVDQLGSARAKFLGAVLNRVDVDRNRYYYSQYYRREYAGYYGNASAAS